MTEGGSIMKRNYGIDLLRLVAMGFVAAMHIIGIGGIITGSELLSGQFLTAQLLKAALLCAVNCYALISGFVGWDRRPKLSGLAALWVRAVVCCLAVTAWFSRRCELDYNAWLSAVLPVTTSQYWYLTAYAGLFVLMPLLNLAVQKMPKKELTWTLSSILLLFCILPISPLTDAFYLHDGYSVLWLAVMYLLGGYAAKYDLPARLSFGMWLLCYGGSVVLAWAARMAVLWLRPHYWYDAYGNILIEYTSPTIVLAAVALLAVFSRLRLSRWAQGAVARLAPCTFGIYLLHAHPLIFRYALEGRFAHLGTGTIPGMLVRLVGCTLVICAAGIVSDWLLVHAMRLTRFDRLLKKLDGLTT